MEKLKSENLDNVYRQVLTYHQKVIQYTVPGKIFYTKYSDSIQGGSNMYREITIGIIGGIITSIILQLNKEILLLIIAILLILIYRKYTKVS